MKKEFLPYLPIGAAIEALLHPFAEVVIHDIAKNKIVAIFNSFSKRRVGDDSCLETELQGSSLPDFFEPYFKTNWDGKKLKSTTINIKDKAGKPCGLLCINVQIHAFDEARELLSRFCGHEGALEQPKALFNEDWREKISVFVHAYLREKGKSIKSLTKDEKRALVLQLHEEGAFRAKNAATFVGEILEISRATVYKYLRDL